jgi:aspartyl protease family protein
MALIGMLVLVASSFLVRRLPIGQTLKMLGAWGLIFLVFFIAFTLRDDFAALGKRVYAEATGGGTVAVQDGDTLRVRQSEDGHFWINADLNGQPVRFLVDSGATMTSISTATARRASIEPSRSLPVLVETANGTVSVQRGRADRLQVGSIERQNLAVHIFGAGEMNVLGMNFLSSLAGWGVEGQWLVLRP